MTPAHAHAVLAAGLDDPRLIERWREGPALLDELELDRGELDVETLTGLVGLTTMVKHNQLRPYLPLTYRVMREMAVDIDLFAAYALAVGNRRSRHAPSPARRATDLIAFVGRWIDPTDVRHVALWDTTRHELALASLGPWHRRRARRRTPRGPLAIRGTVILHEFETDPGSVAAALRAGDLSSIAVAPRWVGYWRDVSGQIALVELDPLSFEVLSLIAADRSPGELVELLETPAAGAAVAAVTQRFVAAGVVVERDERRSPTCG